MKNIYLTAKKYEKTAFARSKSLFKEECYIQNLHLKNIHL